MNKRKSLLTLILALVVIAGAYTLLKSEKTFKSYKLVIAENLISLDPAVAFDDSTLIVIGQVYESLYNYHYLKRPYEIVPMLAEGFPEYLNEGKTIRVKIKKNVRYQDHPAFNGKPRFVKAQDFLNQFKRLAFTPFNSPAIWFFSEKFVGFKDFQSRVGNDWKKLFSEEFKGVEVVDDYTLDFHFIQKNIQSLHYLTMSFVIPLPEEAIFYNQNDFSKSTLGTGPFSIESQTEKKVILKRFKNYREVKYPSSGDRFANANHLLRDRLTKIPFLDEVVVKIDLKGDESWKSFSDKEMDMMVVPQKFKKRFVTAEGFMPSEMKEISAELRHSPSLSIRWLSFNINKPVWGENKNLRKAIAHAIDINKYIFEVVDNSKLAANSVFNPGIRGFRPEKKRPYSYSIEKAQEILKNEGFPAGKGLPDLHFYTRNDKKEQLDLADFLKDQLSLIGINLIVHVQTFKNYLKNARSNDNKMEMWIDGWIYDYPDPENILQLLLSSNGPSLNKSRFKNKKFDSIYKKYVASSSLKERDLLLKDAEALIDSESPWIMLSYESNMILIQKRVRNFRWSSIIRNSFRYIDIEN